MKVDVIAVTAHGPRAQFRVFLIYESALATRLK